MKLILILSLISLSASLPLHRVPSNHLEYQHGNARVKISTNVPAFNLDDILDSSNISCLGDSISISTPIPYLNEGVLMLVNPKVGCSEQTEYRLVTSKIEKDSSDFIYQTTLVEIADYLESFQVKNAGYKYEWIPNKEFMIGSLNVNPNLDALCLDCLLVAETVFNVNVTKSPNGGLPSVKIDLTSKFTSNFDLALISQGRDELIEAHLDVFKKEFSVIEIPNIAKITPKFVIGLGVAIPAGPGAQIRSGFEFKVPEFTSLLFGGGSKKNGSENGFKPSFFSHPVRISPKLEGDSSFQTNIIVTPKILLKLDLLQQFSTTMGLGMSNVFENKLRTGYYAPSCPTNQTKITVVSSSSLEAYLDSQKTNLRPLFSKKLIDVCF